MAPCGCGRLPLNKAPPLQRTVHARDQHSDRLGDGVYAADAGGVCKLVRHLVLQQRARRAGSGGVMLAAATRQQLGIRAAFQDCPPVRVSSPSLPPLSSLRSLRPAAQSALYNTPSVHTLSLKGPHLRDKANRVGAAYRDRRQPHALGRLESILYLVQPALGREDGAAGKQRGGGREAHGRWGGAAVARRQRRRQAARVQRCGAAAADPSWLSAPAGASHVAVIAATAARHPPARGNAARERVGGGAAQNDRPPACLQLAGHRGHALLH